MKVSDGSGFAIDRTNIEGARVIRGPAFSDPRGFFKELYVKTKYEAMGILDQFVQDNMSFSVKGVLRGLHADPMMSKLVQVLHGEAYDVIVDARRNSPTFGKWQGFHLTGDSHTQIYIPAGCLHGFLALSDEVVFCYKQSAEYAPDREVGVRWNDPSLAIAWPISAPPIVSEKDRDNPLFAEAFGA